MLQGWLYSFVAGRRTPSKAWKGGLIWHLEINCLKRHTCWQSKRLDWEGVPQWRARRWGNPEDCAARGSQSWAYGDGLVSSCLWQSFWLRVLPGGAHTAQPRWMPERRILGGGRTRGDSFWSLPNSFSWL